MTRLSSDERDASGRLVNGFDYERQCWVEGGVVQRCGHPAHMDCGCFGRRWAGFTLEAAIRHASDNPALANRHGEAS